MRHNRKKLPKEIASVASTKSKGLNSIIVLSSLPPLLGQSKDDDRFKPAIIKFYDFSKEGTDIVDQRSVQNTISTKSLKWTRKVVS